MRNVTRRIVVAFGVFLVATAATACSDGSPTATVAPSEAQFDGGIGFGSGNFVGTGSTTTTTAADSGSTARGGIGFGSGN